jgi:hypothetical protein
VTLAALAGGDIIEADDEEEDIYAPLIDGENAFDMVTEHDKPNSKKHMSIFHERV